MLHKFTSMKKIITILLILPLLSYSSNNSLSLLSPQGALQAKNKYSFIYETNLLKSKLAAPRKQSSGGGKISDIPFLVSGAMILAGGTVALLYGYNQKNKPGVAITGGVIAVTGGVFAMARVISLTKGGKLFGMIDTPPNTSVAINPAGINVIHNF